MMRFNSKLVLSATLISLMSGCGGGSSNSGPSTGTFSLGLTDAPIDEVYEVNVQLTGVTIKPSGGPAIDFDFAPPVNVDLLSLQNGTVFSLLDGETVEAGSYNWIELHANAEFDGSFNSFVRETKSGAMIELRIPSGSTRFVSGFVITAGQNNSFTLDWDVRKGLTNPTGQDGWHLRPAFRIIDMTEYGSLSGQVADALTMDESCTSDADGNGNIVYVFAGTDIVPDDLDGVDDPVTTAPVRVDDTMAGAYTYTVPFLDPGAYTVAFTCQGLGDDPATDEVGVDEIAFAGQVNAEVATGQNTKNEAPTIE